jgi:GxxExxY protein
MLAACLFVADFVCNHASSIQSPGKRACPPTGCLPAAAVSAGEQACGRLRPGRCIVTDVVYEQESYSIMGACFAVYNEMGSGFVEPVYHECMEKELTARGIPFLSKPSVKLIYKGQPLEHTYEPDIICFAKIILELKAVSALNDQHRAQVVNYLRATGMRLGILINYGAHPKLEYERLVL